MRLGGTHTQILSVCMINDYVSGRAQNDYVCLGGTQPIIECVLRTK